MVAPARRRHRRWTPACIGLGSNQGDRLLQLRCTCRYLEAWADIRVDDYSAVYASAPVGVSRQRAFLNAIVRIRTTLAPVTLLDCLQRIERAAGRRARGRRWGPRAVDCDILLYGRTQLASRRLSIPHPRLRQRLFWLVPLVEAARREWFVSGALASGDLRPLASAAGRCRMILSAHYLREDV